MLDEKILKAVSEFSPTGDQPFAIEKVVEGIQQGYKSQVLVGVTGSGKTFTMAKIAEAVQKPVLVIAHNKTLAAQLATEFREFFPNNAVEYFVSYYDYYQPEAYVPRTDTYIEKDASINDEIDKLRHSATRALMTRRDVIIVSSVSCIYGLGEPEEYYSFVQDLRIGQTVSLNRLARRLIEMQYDRNDFEISRGSFRIRGDTLEIMPSYEELATKIMFFGDQVEKILQFDHVTGEIIKESEEIHIYPAKHFVTSKEKLELAIENIQEELAVQLAALKEAGKLLESQRLESRTLYDLEMLREVGYCSGIENYSRHIGQRPKGSAPWTLLDYFPDDFLIFIDEAHMTIPQLNGMYHGDMSRKRTLVEFGFRLPSALDNRPLSFQEFEKVVNQVVHVSATPGPYESSRAEQVVEQVIRPTGLIDPSIEVKPTLNQIDDLLHQIKICISKEERVLVTTLTKRMSEELAEYLREEGIKVHYIHSEIHTLERSEILRDLRSGTYDVLVGINLLREGLDLPEVSLVAILDADKEGYLRSSSALIQTVGRAARHVDGRVIMYADRITGSMEQTINETQRRREIQHEYNKKHGITPQSIKKTIKDINDRVKTIKIPDTASLKAEDINPEELSKVIKGLENQMRRAAKDLDFEKAALFRDEIQELKKLAKSSYSWHGI
ncbi:MAG: excinuclease ABC subunit B [Dehalococcoidia bacterium]|nr:excinuclease ABC subunit B [Dehalococcoidia bacterium]